MPITVRTAKIVWGLAAGRCSFPGCGLQLVKPGKAPDPHALLGDLAHIVARKRRGPRGRRPLEASRRNDPENLVLLCKIHHKLVDDQPNQYTTEVLAGYKKDHEQWVRERTDREMIPSETPIPPTPTEAVDSSVRDEDVATLSRVARQRHDDPDAWASLAWAYYQSGRYTEALDTIAKARRHGFDPGSADEIKACILTEDGVRRSDESSIRQGRRIFERLASSRGHSIDFYNFGNALAGLGEHEDAARAYETAKEIEPSDPRIWKNLGSTYHRLGRHEEELECLDHALRLDPEKPEALASKGVTLLMDWHDPEGGIELLQRALEVAPDHWINWPHIWYWLAQCHRAVGDHRQALDTVDHGLERAPSDRYLRDLKGRLLTTLLAKDRAYARSAAEFFEAEIENNPFDYSVRSQLVAIRLGEDNDQGAWGILQDAYELFELGSSEPLTEFGVTPHQVLRAFRYLPDYAAYRRRQSVGDYWSLTDSLASELEIDRLPEPSGEATDFLVCLSAVSFGLLADAVANTESRDAATVIVGYATASVVLMRGVNLFTARVAEAEYGSSAGSDFDPLSELPDFVSYALLREISRQVGWIIHLFGLPEDQTQLIVDSQPAEEFQEAIWALAVHAILQTGTAEDVGDLDVDCRDDSA